MVDWKSHISGRTFGTMAPHISVALNITGLSGDSADLAETGQTKALILQK
jgi:hypothetical protein